MKNIKKIILLSFYLVLFSCGNKSEKEKVSSRTEIIENQTAKVLVTYNQAIKEHKKAVNGVYEMAKQLNWSDRTLSEMRPGWKQEGWDTLYVHFKLKVLKSNFKTEFGEDEFNKLSLKIDENWNEKMD